MHQAGELFPRARPLGDAALTIEFGSEIDPRIHARVMGFASALGDRRRAGMLPGVVEWVPAFASVTVFLDPAGAAPEACRDALLALARAAAPRSRAGTRWRIPVCFESGYGPDLEALAEARSLSRERVVELVCDAEFRVFMLGFLPGFAYLGGLPAACELPRRATPRRAVPERSVAVAGRMAAIYPWESPGGWHMLGRTPVRPFDATDPQRPALFAPGDIVQWQPIDEARYRELDARATRGELARDELVVAEENPR